MQRPLLENVDPSVLPASSSASTAIPPFSASRAKKVAVKFNSESVGVSLLPGAQFTLDPLSKSEMALVALPMIGISACWRCILIVTLTYFVKLGENITAAKWACTSNK
jgi:hypothetical protein